MPFVLAMDALILDTIPIGRKAKCLKLLNYIQTIDTNHLML